MTAPAVVVLSGENENAATAVGGTGTVSFLLMSPISGADGVVYAMASSEVYVMVNGEWVQQPSLRATDNSLSYYKVIVTLDDWQEVFNAPLPAVITTLSAMRQLSISDAQMVVPEIFVPISMLGAANGVAQLGSDGLLKANQRPPAGAHVYAANAVALDESALQEGGFSGTLTMTQGQVIENKIIRVDSIVMHADHTELRNCKIIADNVNAIHVDAVTGLEIGRRIIGCEIINPAGRAIGGAGFTVENTYGHLLGDDFIELGRSHAEPTVIRGCKADSFRPLAAAHFDGVQMVTLPAAPVIIDDCDLFMNLDVGFTEPGDAGSTGGFFAAADVAINEETDPDPARFGRVYISNSRFRSNTGNYSISIAENFSGVVTVEACAIGEGITAAENITASTVVYGGNNTDLAGAPLVTAIGSSDLGDYLLVGDPRQAGGSSGPTTLDDLSDVDVGDAQSGQFLSLVGATWEAVDAPSGGGGGGSPLSIVSNFITSGNVNIGGTGAVWTVIPGTQKAIAAVAGEKLSAAYGFGGIDISGLYFDIGVIVAGQIVRQLFSPAFPPGSGYEGAPGLIHDPNVSGALSNAPFFTAAAGDLETGNCTFAIVCRGNPTGNFLMTADVPVTYTLYNNH